MRITDFLPQISVDTGIQVLLGDIEETLETTITSYPLGAMVQTPPPTPPHTTKTDIKLGAADRTDTKEVGQRRYDDGLRGMGKPPWVQPLVQTREGGASHSAPTKEGETSVGPAIRRQQEKVGPAIGNQRRRGNICEGSRWRSQEKVVPAIGANMTLVRPAMAALTVRPDS